jgi:hypothetical protein
MFAAKRWAYLPARLLGWASSDKTVSLHVRAQVQFSNSSTLQTPPLAHAVFSLELY